MPLIGISHGRDKWKIKIWWQKFSSILISEDQNFGHSCFIFGVFLSAVRFSCSAHLNRGSRPAQPIITRRFVLQGWIKTAGRARRRRSGCRCRGRPSSPGMATTLGGSPTRLSFSSATVLHTLSHKIPIPLVLLQRPFSSSASSASRPIRLPNGPLSGDPGLRRSFFVRSGLQSAAEETPSQTYDFDLFTIGAGSGGVRASRFAANYGASVAVCELPFSTISSDTAGGVGGTYGIILSSHFLWISRFHVGRSGNVS